MKSMRQWRRRAAMAALGVSSLLLTGCPGGAVVGVVTEASNGGIYRLILGATLEIRLPVSEGDCAWFITSVNSTFLTRIDQFDSLAPAGRKQLSDGTTVEYFQLQGQGTGTTTLEARRLCGEARTESGEVFTLRIDVIGTGI